MQHPKDSGIRIRVERGLRSEFLEACQSADRPAAQVLREFMRQYVKAHKAAGKRPAKKRGARTRDV